jgi:streptogramin lyase/two-component sensor histidine kinase
VARFSHFRLVVALLGLLWGLTGAWPAVAEQWQRDPILSQLLVKQMVTDAAGYRWIAASEGVFRYDGYELLPLQQLVRAGGVAAPKRAVLSVVLDRTGRLWLGGEEGLFCFAPRTGVLQAVPLPQTPPGGKIGVGLLFLHPRSGQLWVGFHSEVLVLDPDHPQRSVGPPRQLGGGPAYLQADGSAAGVWVSFRQPNWPVRRVYTDAEPPGAVQLAPTGPPLRRVTTNCFVVPVPGTAPLQLISASALFSLAADGRLREERRWLPAGNEDNFTLHHASPDSLWEWASQGYRMRLIVRGSRVGPVDVDTMELGTGPVDHRHSYVLEQDSLGLQWCFSQFWRGCFKQRAARRRVVQPLVLASGRPTPSARAIVRLPDGRLLLGAYGGPLVQAADSPNAPLRPLLVRQNGVVRLPLGYDLLVTRAGEVLFSEDMRGISQLNPLTGVLRALPFATGAQPLPVHCAALLEDRAGRVWCGTSSGLFRVFPRQGNVGRYATGAAAQALLETDILDLAEDPGSGDLWLATAQGLYLLTPATGALRQVGGRDESTRPLPTEALLSVASAGAGRAWVGTNTHGLLLVDARAGVVRQLDLADGMPSRIVPTVLCQPDGTVWAGTFAGLVRYEPATQRLAVLTEADGLIDAEMNRNSAYADPLTRALWFGGVGGLHRIWPHSTEASGLRYAPARLLVTATVTPSAARDSGVVMRPVMGDQLPRLRLGAEPTAFVELRLALTNLFSPDQTHYAYRLLRPDGPPISPWLPTTRRLVLRGMAAGDYLVEARAETVTGQPAANTVRVPLHVERVWWQHPLAWATGAILLAMLGYLVFWLQGRRARREAWMREELAANLHDEVGTLLTKISLMAEVLQQQPGVAVGPEPEASAATANLTGRLLRSSRDAIQAMRDVVWSIDSRTDSVQALLDRMQDYLDQTTTDAGLEYTFEVDPSGQLQSLRPLVRKQLYLVFKEAVTNVLRHARGATTVVVRLVREGGGFVLEVTDDGQSALKTGRSGLGLRNMEARAKVLGGALETGPRPDGQPGFRVKLRIAG